MTQTQWKDGTIVWLKSGSPKMTIKDTLNGGSVVCTWFVDREPKQHTFTPDQLTDKDPSEQEPNL